MPRHAVSEGPRLPDAAPGATLPERYEEGWIERFLAYARPGLVERAQILDVGSGRHPVLPPTARPPGSTYVGLDASMTELESAPPGSYDELICADVGEWHPELQERFDLLLSWQVLEHVKPLQRAMDHIHSYARPGGLFVALLSGSSSVQGLINRAIPDRAAVWALKTLLRRNPETVFPAHYDHCDSDALVQMLDPWTEAQVIPAYRGAAYFRFSRALQAAYLRYENWAATTGRRKLASHYFLVAVR